MNTKREDWPDGFCGACGGRGFIHGPCTGCGQPSTYTDRERWPERTRPGTIAAALRETLVATAEHVTLTEERTGGDGRASFSATINCERFVVTVARDPRPDPRLDDERDRLAAEVERLTGEDADESEEWWCDECGGEHEPTPRVAGAFGGEAPSADAVLAERRATEDAIAPLRSVDGVSDVEVLVEHGAEYRTEIRWTRDGAPHGLAAAFGAGRELARAVLANQSALVALASQRTKEDR